MKYKLTFKGLDMLDWREFEKKIKYDDVGVLRVGPFETRVSMYEVTIGSSLTKDLHPFLGDYSEPRKEGVYIVTFLHQLNEEEAKQAIDCITDNARRAGYKIIGNGKITNSLLYLAVTQWYDTEVDFNLVPQRIREWMKNNGWKEYYATMYKSPERRAHISYRNKSDTYFHLEWIGHESHVPTISKDEGRSKRMVLFTPDELKFFDMMGYQIDSYQSRISKQNIEDWWGIV